MGILGCLFFLLPAIISSRTLAQASLPVVSGVANAPPRGWNSYDSFGWIVNEGEFLQNAEIVSKRLLKHGYEYVVVDYLWYRRLTSGASRNSYGYDVIDQWGRVMPDPGRWPSSGGGNGFKEIAQKVHNMGLKFGIHLMRGISVQAVDNNTPILDVSKGAIYVEGGRQWRACDIGIHERTCGWMSNGFMSTNTDLGAGRAFLRSLYTQYAEWGVDFVKLDCVFGDDLDVKEIVTVSELLEGLERSIIFSLSPGTHVNSDMAGLVSKHANMYRVTADDWDTWPDIESHFNVARDIAASSLIGSKGLNGMSWPDLDMLPLGWLTNSYGNVGPYRKCNLTSDEQKTQVTLWSMFRSPLIFGGDLRNTDESTFSLITNPTLLEINSFSKNNMEFQSITFRHEIKSRNSHNHDTKRSQFFDATHKTRIDLTSCRNPLAKVWKIQGSQERKWIYWENSTGDVDDALFYTDKSMLLMQLGDGYEEQYQGRVHLLSIKKKGLCLDASTHRRLAASERNGNRFSPCEWKSSQMWELMDDGSIRSDYSSLCLIMEAVKDSANSGGGRSWIATGRAGEVYVSFFNLNVGSTMMETTIQDIVKALPPGFVNKESCSCSEVWSGRDFGIITSTLSFQVPGHGCALFVLHCN